jgi:hypothetical protein
MPRRSRGCDPADDALRRTKSEAQLDAQILHRSGAPGRPTDSLINQLAPCSWERGVVVAKGRRRLDEYLAELLDETASRRRSEPSHLRSDPRHAPEWRELDRRIEALTAEFVTRAREERGRSSARDHPGLRRSQRDGAGRRDWHRRDVPPSP